jgi:RND family efflux transporter MFP subunit
MNRIAFFVRAPAVRAALVSALPAVVAVALAAVVAACGKPPAEAAKKSAPTPPVHVRLDEVTTATVPRTLTLTGSVVADKQSEVAANVNGRVIVASVERGQSVKKGDVIAQVDSLAASFSADAANAQSKASDAQVDLAQKECARTEALFAKGAITQAEYDRQKTTCTSQVFAAQAAKASASLATKVQNDSFIRAPFNGVIGERYVNVGEYVQPQTRVASLLSIDPARIQISVPEAAVSLVKEGQILDVSVSAYPDRTFPATVKFVAPALRANSRDLLIEASADNKEGLLKPGMFATVKLAVGDDARPTIAAGSVRHEDTASMVFVVRDAGEGQKRVDEVVVQPGQLTKDNRVPILGGLHDGDQVVLDPPSTLKDGALVVLDAAPATTPGDDVNKKGG